MESIMFSYFFKFLTILLSLVIFIEILLVLIYFTIKYHKKAFIILNILYLVYLIFTFLNNKYLAIIFLFIICIILVLVSILIINLILYKIYFCIKNYRLEKNKLENKLENILDYKLIKLCLNNIEKFDKRYNIKENEYLEKFDNSKEKYINYLIDLLPFIEKTHSEQLPMYISFYGIIISSIPIFLTINNNDTFTILYFIFIAIICLFSIIQLLSKTKFKQKLKIRNFEKYLKEYLNNINL